jgi:hypothetical protein
MMELRGMLDVSYSACRCWRKENRDDGCYCVKAKVEGRGGRCICSIPS